MVRQLFAIFSSHHPKPQFIFRNVGWLGVVTIVFLLTPTVLWAQGTGLGLNEFAANTNLGTDVNLINLISRVINIILGFLGVIAIGLIIYAGWLWMTSGGDAQKIDKAKKIMLGAVIGLAIILSAFAIASFIIRQIRNATTGGGGSNLCWDGNPPPCPPPPLPGSYLRVLSQGPMGNGIKLCAAVQATFSEAVQWSTVNTTNFTIQEAASGTLFASGTYQPGVNAANIAFSHVGNEFAPNTAYRVTLRSGFSGLRGVSNINLRTDKVWTFTTGSESDNTAPEVVTHQPPSGGAEVCRQTPIQVVFSEPMLATSFYGNVILRDRASRTPVSLSEPTFGDGYRIANFRILNPLEPFTEYEVVLKGGPGGLSDLCGIPLAADYVWTFTTGPTTDCSPSLSSVVPETADYGQIITLSGSNIFLDGEIYINDFPADSNSFPGTVPPENILCYAGVSRDGATTCTASQIKSRTPVGASTGPAYDQDGYSRTVGQLHLNVAGANSNDLPFTITSPYIDSLSPTSGGQGQFITISGWNFGNTPGQVRFVRPNGTWTEAEPPQACSDWWSETEIVVKVPAGLVAGVSYQVEVVTAAGGSNAENKRSNSESFLVTSQSPGPGICSLSPSSSPLLDLPINVTLRGESFGTSRGASVVTFDVANNINSTTYSSWNQSEIVAQTPTGPSGNLLGAGQWRVQVKVGNQLSNWKRFTVSQETTTYPRVIESASCVNNTQSPSPYKDSTNACGNAVISARFTLPMNENSFTVGANGTIRVEECGNGSEPGSCTVAVGLSQPTFLRDSESNVIGFSVLPAASLRAGFWYRGTISSGVRSRAGNNMRSDYVWYFKVASATCPLNSVVLTPSYATIRELSPDPGSTQMFTAAVTASNCNMINAANYTWRWTTTNNSADPPPPRRIQLAGGLAEPFDQTGVGTPALAAEALDWTPPARPARIQVEAVGENKSSASEVYVSSTFCVENSDCNACGAGTSRCVSGVCDPVITDISPADGAPHTWTTITGCYFGSNRGRIIYNNNVEGLWPDARICGPSTWSNTQVISEAPPGFTSGPLILERANPPGGSVSSNPRVFGLSTTLRPGLCRLSPAYHYESQLGTPQATITLEGNGFGDRRELALGDHWFLKKIKAVFKSVLADSGFPTDTSSVNYYYLDPLTNTQRYSGSATTYPLWGNNQVQAITPAAPATVLGRNRVSVNKGVNESNRLAYELRSGSPPGEGGELPKIVSVSPAPASTNICRNTVLTVTFDRPVTSNTLTAGQVQLAKVPCTADQTRGWRWLVDMMSKLVSPVKAQTNTGCLTPVRVQIVGSQATITPVQILSANARYEVKITSPNIDCPNSGGLCQWFFNTKRDICRIHSVEVNPPYYTYNAAGQTKEFFAQAKAEDGQSLLADYRWVEEDEANVITVTTTLDNQSITAAANNQNGQATLVVTADGTNDGNSNQATGQAVLNVFLCELPWEVSDTDYDFNLRYCRGRTNDTDPLPEFSVTSVDHNPATVDGILREYIFKHPLADEIIGLRIYQNPDHLSPRQWYDSRPDILRGQPSSFVIDGYQALRDNQTVYVGAVAKNNTNLYTNIYVLSFSQGASAQTLNIFNQLINNWLFNPALPADEQTKLQRDLGRLQDLAGIASKLASYAVQNSNQYPLLTAGTFQIGRSTSAWSSWQAELGNSLGAALPVDPLNRFVNCPQGYDPNTCWRSADKSFVCPAGSYVYQYVVSDDGRSYRLLANMEFKNVTWYGNPTVVIGNSDACNSYEYTVSNVAQ